MENPKISVCIPTYNNVVTIKETIGSVLMQTFGNYEILIGDDHSSDNTIEEVKKITDSRIRIYVNKRNLGCGNNLTKLYLNAHGEIVYYLCGDDLITKDTVLEKTNDLFDIYPNLDVLGRKYYWFTTNPTRPVRIKDSNNILAQADQVSGFAFRKEAMDLGFSNKPFVEMASMVSKVMRKNPYGFAVVDSYTIAVRIANNGSTNPKVYLESPLKNWYEIVGKQRFVVKNFIGLIQIKNYGSFKALVREIWYLVYYYPLTLVDVRFWFFTLLTLFTPRFLLRQTTIWWREYCNGRTFKWPEY